MEKDQTIFSWGNGKYIADELGVSRELAETIRVRHCFINSELSENFGLTEDLSLVHYDDGRVTTFDLKALKKLTNKQLVTLFNSIAIIEEAAELGEF